MKEALATILLALMVFPAAAEPRRLICDYTQSASPQGLKAEKFRLEFIIDGERAVMIGNKGISDVEMHSGAHGFTFLEKVPAGIVQTTTVAKDGSSVHSRHTIIVDLVPSQYYGKCYRR
jgi:hypothetical protein